MGKKKKKREGTEQIEPFHHTHLPLSLQQALPNLFCFPTNDEQDASPSETSVSLPLLNIALTLFQHLRQFRHEQPSFLPACTNTRLSLPLSLPLSLSLPLLLFLSQTHTRRTMHTFAQHRRSLACALSLTHTHTNARTHALSENERGALSHYCTPPLICTAVNVCAISEVLNQLCDAELR